MKTKLEVMEDCLRAISTKEKTIVRGSEWALYMARSCLNVHCGYDFRIDDPYKFLLDEWKEELDEN